MGAWYIYIGVSNGSLDRAGNPKNGDTSLMSDIKYGEREEGNHLATPTVAEAPASSLVSGLKGGDPGNGTKTELYGHQIDNNYRLSPAEQTQAMVIPKAVRVNMGKPAYEGTYEEIGSQLLQDIGSGLYSKENILANLPEDVLKTKFSVVPGRVPAPGQVTDKDFNLDGLKKTYDDLENAVRSEQDPVKKQTLNTMRLEFLRNLGASWELSHNEAPASKYNEQQTKVAAIEGLPDRSDYGDLSQLGEDAIATLVRQRRLADFQKAMAELTPERVKDIVELTNKQRVDALSPRAEARRLKIMYKTASLRLLYSILGMQKQAGLCRPLLESRIAQIGGRWYPKDY